MSMTVALTGLNAAQTDIAATSHNIANVATTGFRSSRVEFAEVYNSSPYTVSRTTTGSGTSVMRIGQDFGQGNIVATGGPLDLAIEGSGFFAVQPAPDSDGNTQEVRYTRAGAFGMTKDGTVVNSAGQSLLGLPVAADGTALNTSMSFAGPITVPPTFGEARATSAAQMTVTLPTDPAMLGGQAAVPPAVAFDSDDTTSYAFRTPFPVTDENGHSIQAEAYFVKTAAPTAGSTDTTYEIHLLVDGQQRSTASAQTITFDVDGTLTTTAPLSFGTGATALSLDFSGSELRNESFSVQSVGDDGTAPVALTAMEVDSKGTVWASYGADHRLALGKVMMATFANPQGLKPVGNSSFTSTADSGAALFGVPGSPGMGDLRAGSLEKANVELTEELVNLITAQRNYQANAKSMETSSAMMQTILNLRS